eukprot:360315-Chlamydomonas_euryale.AAC.7
MTWPSRPCKGQSWRGRRIAGMTCQTAPDRCCSAHWGGRHEGTKQGRGQAVHLSVDGWQRHTCLTAASGRLFWVDAGRWSGRGMCKYSGKRRAQNKRNVALIGLLH